MYLSIFAIIQNSTVFVCQWSIAVALASTSCIISSMNSEHNLSYSIHAYELSTVLTKLHLRTNQDQYTVKAKL